MVRQEVVAGTMRRVDINVILKVAVPIENLVEYVLGSWSVPFLGTRNENYNCPQNVMTQCCRGSVRCANILLMNSICILHGFAVDVCEYLHCYATD